ncbi:hypothetical protein SAMN05216389_13411 [Oceanobacillus limi]|uniref:Aminoglycoside phosphotransferase domain-containing protein n=1 Tax=Oceanobacillus limi TaxID=930131 RepID=A0A1I0HG02_9BACI|nr:phosphotransferase [Oceanobacillus limi]SET82775.1 hypothetical protein SAMN05216389_13411 [Oceanobacillus limi]
MSNFYRRDDNKLDRLSSFFYWEGGLDLKLISPIKANVFLVKTIANEKFIVKSHHNKNNVYQQWSFFKRNNGNMIAPFVRFPNSSKFLIDENSYWTITPYIPGRKLNYKNPEDRIEAVNTLHAFHETATAIYINRHVKKQLFYLRWYNRLQMFKKTEYIFAKFGYVGLYKDIIQTTERQIQLVSHFPWKRIQRKAEEKGVWVHGDVAAHNFIKNDKTYLIDFDLLYCTTQLYDFIQLGQRFLPYINWDIDKLLAYRMVREKELSPWILSLSIPSDVLREWIHFLRRHRSESSISAYLEELSESWSKRTNFLKTAVKMVK